MLEGYPIDISGNTLNISDYGTCVAIYTGSEGKGPANKEILEQDPVIGIISSEYVIICPEQQKMYTNIVARRSSLTGTPGRLRDNYFGTFRGLVDSTPGMKGSGSRLDFFTK